MDKEVFCKEIKEQANKLGYLLNIEQQEKFYKYMNLLNEWNKKINLTAIEEPKEIITKHFIDSLSILGYIEESEKVADIGTGAGFPGIPIKIAKSSIEMTLIDSLNKRIGFLNEVIKEIELNNIEAIHSRAEETGQNKKYRESFDIVTSRAVAKLDVLVEYMLPLVKVGGKCICMKGPDCEQEIKDAKKAINVLGGTEINIEKFTLADTDINRTIIIIKKENPTPSTFPRKAGTPIKKPIK